MDQWVGMQAEGRLSLRKGEGEGEGFCRAFAGIEPLTFILSPCARGEAKNGNAVKSGNFQCELRRL
ncbi:MAG: hypothetical protein DME39_03325 [Verrucomicrobia bacterium]|nr:MAG: hypothetical protein DME39_03325 [Verrucomicrobiota bacterium]